MTIDNGTISKDLFSFSDHILNTYVALYIHIWTPLMTPYINAIMPLNVFLV